MAEAGALFPGWQVHQNIYGPLNDRLWPRHRPALST